MTAGARRDASVSSTRRPGWAGAFLPLLLLVACASPSQSPPPRGEGERVPVQSFENLELRETSEGKLEWILRAKRATRSAANQATKLDSLKVDFYQGSDRVRSVLTSDSGRVDTQ